jgi:hypothetical protein
LIIFNHQLSFIVLSATTERWKIKKKLDRKKRGINENSDHRKQEGKGMIDRKKRRGKDCKETEE